MDYLVSTFYIILILSFIISFLLKRIMKHIDNLLKLELQELDKKTTTKNNLTYCKKCGCLMFSDEKQCPDCGF